MPERHHRRHSGVFIVKCRLGKNIRMTDIFQKRYKKEITYKTTINFMISNCACVFAQFLIPITLINTTQCQGLVQLVIKPFGNQPTIQLSVFN